MPYLLRLKRCYHLPKPTLSEEDIKNEEEYTSLLSICENYHDWSAVLQIREMYKAGMITEKQYARLYVIPAFDGMKDYSDELWSQIEDQIEKVASVLNGKQQDKLDKDGLISYLTAASKRGTVYINVFDSQEKRERVLLGVAYINQWFQDPTEENFEYVEQVYFSEDLTPGEIILLSCHMQYSVNQPSEVLDGKRKVTVLNFLEKRGVLDRAQDALEQLFA